MDKSKLELTIKNVLIAKKTQPTDENITEACFETIVESLKRNKKDDQSDISTLETLLEIICRKKYFRLNNTSLMAIKGVISIAPASVCGFLKFYFKDNKASPQMFSENSLDAQLFNVLLSNCHIICVSNFIAKYYDIRGFFDMCDEERKMHLLCNSMHAFIDHVNVFEYIKTNKNNTNQVISKYLEYRNNNPLTFSEIDELSYYITAESPLNYNILFMLFEFNKRNKAKLQIELIQGKSTTTQYINIFNPRIIELAAYEFLESSRTEDELVDLFLMMPDAIQYFDFIIKELNQKFINENKMQKLLKLIVSHIKIEEFAEIISEIDISKHFSIFKGISNIDLSVFVKLYDIARRGTEFESLPLNTAKAAQFPCKASVSGTDSLDCVLACLPSFVYYCTDFLSNIENLILIFKAHFETHKSIISTAIEKMIYSHTSNINNTITLSSPISKTESFYILKALTESNLVYTLLNAFVEFNNIDVQGGLQEMINLTKLDMASETVQYLMDDQSEDNRILSALRLLPFFVKGKHFAFDFISRILELAASQQFDIQKKAYYLLTVIYENSATDVCICDILYSTLQQKLTPPAYRNRFLLQMVLLKRNCSNTQCNKQENREKFISEIIKGLKTGNAKCKKTISDEICNFAFNHEFLDYLFARISNKSVDPVFLYGSLECLLIILEQMNKNQECLNNESKMQELRHLILSKTVDVSNYSKEVVRPVLSIFTLYVKERNQEQIKAVVDSYIQQFSKKYNRELKQFCILAEKNNWELSRTMRTLLKFRNQGGRSKDISVINKPAFNKLI